MAAPSCEHEVAPRAAAAARIMTARGLLIRLSSGVAAAFILTLVTPAEFGFLATVRSIAALLEQGTELGLAWPLLREHEEPSREDYAALAGAQVLAVLAALALAVFWSPAWRGWLLAMIAAMLAVSFGTGARIRLERDLRYGRIAFADVSALALHTAVLIGFLAVGRFTAGVFAAQIALTLYYNAVLFLSSPGPLPTLRLRRIFERLRASAGYGAAYLVFVAREQAPTILVAALFDLRAAGAWAFAARLAKFLQFAHEGFARVAVPAAARLAPDRPALRRLASKSLEGAALLAAPAAAVAVFALPAIPLVWPQWAPAIDLARIFVVCDVAAGILGAALGPVALALAGWRAVLIEHAAPLAAAAAGLAALHWLRSEALWCVVVPVAIVAIVALFAVTERAARPAWSTDLTRLAAVLACAAAVYIAVRALVAAPAVAAAVASAALAVLLWRRWLAQFHLARSAS